MSEYYDGTKLLSLLDINGNKPEVIISSGNRTAGKTTWWNKFCVNRYIKYREKFMVLFRWDYEVDSDCADKFFKDIGGLFFTNHVLTCQKKAKGLYYELYLDDCECGYATCINKADMIKKYSHYFSDVVRIILDEFQSETNHYVPEEVKKVQSIHTSVARGRGEQVRFVQMIFIGNLVSLINPYYIAMGISHKLKSETKFLRGDGFVVEQCFNESASKAQLNSGFNKAFSAGGENSYLAYSAQNVYLNDSEAFIEKPTGSNRYICTIKYEGKHYGIREYKDSGVIFCDVTADMTYPIKIAVTTDDHNINYVMLRANSLIISNLRYYFEHGCFRFRDLRCKQAVFTLLTY